MTGHEKQAKFPFEDAGSSNRILLLAIAGILFLTLYPFRFDFSAPPPGNVFPFLLGGWGKDAGRLDLFLNVLLFVPYGFGVALKLRRRNVSKAAALALAFAAGALLSYTVELLQLYIPQRDSGWEDVLTNSTGSAVGLLLFDLFGPALLRFLSTCEQFVDEFLTLRRAIALFLLYLASWFAFSVPLQKEVSLRSWKSNCFLEIGSRVPPRRASSWTGEISRLEVWDHALPADFAQGLNSGQSEDAAAFQSLVMYDFSGSPPYSDRRGFLPDLDGSSRGLPSTGSNGVVLDRESSLISRSPVSALVENIRRTRQFSIRIVCTPSQVAGIDGRIVSISDASPLGDLELRQDGPRLVVWFRNSVLLKWPHLVWSRSDVFVAQQTRDILVSYDGLTLSIYIDGKRQPGNHEFGPGTSLAMLIHRGRTSELIGYRYVFYVIVFWPAGCFLGLASRKLARPPSRFLLMIMGILLPSVFFEILIVHLSGRPISLSSVALSAILILAGSLWINSDGTVPIHPEPPKIAGLAP
jgi:VanZ family protein